MNCIRPHFLFFFAIKTLLLIERGDYMKYNEKITIMQNNLRDIRRFLHLSGRELGEMIGVTKQLISYIENGKTKLTKTQYLAIMYVLNTEIFPNLDDKEHEGLEKLLMHKVVQRKKLTHIDTLIFE